MSLTAIGLVIAATIGIGLFGLRISRTTSDFYVASRAVSPRWNASAISGEYLSAASFLGIAGLVLVNGADMLWFSVGYTAGYLMLLVLIAAPLRRSGAYTLPDFAETRFESAVVRRICSCLVVGIGTLYLLPQLRGAGLTVHTVTGAPPAMGAALVAVIVVINVAAGGMRSITFVQAFQYWLKLFALAAPIFVILVAWRSSGHPIGVLESLQGAGAEWAEPLSTAGGRDHPLYATYSLLLALCFGTMGLPHVLVRFYTNPDGRAARRTTVVVLALLSAFYLFPPLYAILGRSFAPELIGSGAETVVLQLPGRIFPGTVGDLLGALVAAGAFAAFLSTSSGLTVAIAGVIDQDLLRNRLHRLTGGDYLAVNSFRIAALLAIAIPYLFFNLTGALSLADTVGLAFAVAASTFCPLLVLGIWWRRMSVVGAAAGLVVGGVAAIAAVLINVIDPPRSGWPKALIAQPAAWTMPLAFLTVIVVSKLTPRKIPRGTARSMVRLHTPEAVDVDRGLPPG
ncbi:sodium/solute symporter [Kribbella sp. CA-293567]|uniref:sodium/solute symporter n=1 Tax=Kribbella sp. CA-293567 TaxID=3002436 RepID=UPI0022DE4E59|nr:cation acetate symporter [Kribbella sp. CA-293567]WBQ04867.1 cation acetate symporter [Kribbella sp. CA-293567]